MAICYIRVLLQLALAPAGSSFAFNFTSKEDRNFTLTLHRIEGQYTKICSTAYVAFVINVVAKCCSRTLFLLNTLRSTRKKKKQSLSNEPMSKSAQL